MSICGITKESPWPALLCHAEMKECQRVSAAAPAVTPPLAEQTRRAKLRWATRRCERVAGVYPPPHQPTDPLPPALTGISSVKSARVHLCQDRDVCVIDVYSFLANPYSPRSE